MAVEGEVGEFAVFDSRDVGQTGLDDGFGGGEFDGDDLAAAGGDFGEELVDETLRDGIFWIERKNQAGHAIGESQAKGDEPDLLAQGDKAGGAKVENCEGEIYGEVIVEKPIAGEGGDFSGDGEYADRGRAVVEKEFHGESETCGFWARERREKGSKEGSWKL